jgi:pimeloyl-ACP methyl ester carboxylesterase
MSYEDTVDQLYLDRLRPQIVSLVEACNPTPPAAPAIFFFPGGLGSQLLRAVQPAPDGPPYAYYTVWLNCAIVLGLARDLELDGVEDSDDEYILPDGSIDFIQSYDGFEEWCASAGIPLFIVGWDWRRKSGHAAHFFLNKFVPLVDAVVAAGGYANNPLDNFWLVGHSFGGMVVKRILNETNNSYVQRMKGAITVATPFYGSGGQVHRFFVGEADVNATLYPDGPATCTRIVSTLPANYEILFLDQNTFTANEAAFLHDPAGYNLEQYPSLDAASGVAADPYHPIPGPPVTPPATGLVRYIQNYNFSWDLLTDGLSASQRTSQALDPSVAAKFWNIRCVQTDEAGADLAGTCVAQTWALVDANFDPDVGNDPITDAFGAGDSVVPAWSARLIGLDDSHVITLHAPDLEHQNLMNEGIIQEQLSNLLNLPPQLVLLARANAATKPVIAASRVELNAVTKLFHDAISPPELSTFERKEAVFKIVRKLSLDQRKALLTRAYFDAFKTPAQLRGSFDRSRKAE